MQYNVLEYLENAASQWPTKVAYSVDDECMTFERIYEISRSIACGLLAIVSTRKRPVVVFEERSPKTIAAMLGIVYSGNCYATLDPSLPTERLQAILDQLNPVAVIVIASERPEVQIHCPLIHYADVMSYPPDERLLSTIRHSSTDQDPLYIIFTSGSSGMPKGVVTSHRALIDYIDAFSAVARITQEDVLGGQAPLDYVAAIRDIYLPLKLGASCRLLPKKLFSLPAKLLDALDEYRITTLCWVASAFSIVAKMNAFAYKKPRYVSKVIFTGAVMPSRYLRVWQLALPDALYINHYGPTEITASCTYACIDHLVEADEVLPIGVPYPNTGIVLLDEDDREVTEPGAIGEICVHGCCLALGYYNAPELTAQAFVQNPLNLSWPERIYRTGDYAHRDARGVLWFHGRKDSQIKLMGHRVEMNEIENAARSLDGVEDCCCFFHAEKEVLWLFVQSKIVTQTEVFVHLKARLPAFMIPRKLVLRENFPQFPNGKVDRQSLMTEMEKESHAKNHLT